MANIVALKKLNNNHLNMVEDLILRGDTQRNVAKKYGVSEAWLSRLRQTALFKEEESALRQLKRSENITKLNALVPARRSLHWRRLWAPHLSAKMGVWLRTIRKCA
jgi:hypothetical protein